MLSGSTVSPVVRLSQSANRDFASRLGLAKGVAKRVVVGQRLKFLNWPRSVIQPSPMASVIVSASAGLDMSSQRRGVTPLVLLLNRSGYSSARSLTVTVRSSRE